MFGPCPCRVQKAEHKRVVETDASLRANITKDAFEKYVRTSAYHVRDEIYEVCAELTGHGFSYHECQIALSVVPRLFGCTWTIHTESRGRGGFNKDEEGEDAVDNPNEMDQFDNNTLPKCWDVLKQILTR